MIVDYKFVDFEGNLKLFQNERDEVLVAEFSSPIEKIEQLSLLAITAYKGGFNDFSLETFELAFSLLLKPYDFYECRMLLRGLNQANFAFLTDKLCAILYDISENCKGDLTDKLLFKLKMFELSNADFKEKLDSEILAILFNRIGQYRINHSLSDSLPFFIIYLIKNKPIDLAKGILIEFKEYLIDIVELIIFENNKLDSSIQLKDFYQSITPVEIGIEKFNELELLVSKLE